VIARAVRGLQTVSEPAVRHRVWQVLPGTGIVRIVT